MVQKRLFLALLAVTAIGLAGVPAIAPADAQGLADRRPRDENTIEPGGYSLDDAVELAQSRYRAKAVKAETVEEQGRRIHYIRLLSAEGRVWTVRVDAATGRMQ
ncbi:MAG: PepSY domain-containing protein [Steroidobacteraceae bacterium]